MTCTVVLRIAEGLDLPVPSAVTQTYGFIARKGAGKTYAAGKLVEELSRVGAPVIVIDPIGNWYGLRLGADGKSPGLSIPVFGGLHGDVPLGLGQGEQLADLIVTRNLSAVIDVSTMRKNERKRFVAQFAERLFHESKREKNPRVIVFEEAQVFAPQRAGASEAQLLGAVEDIVRLGRNFGLGAVLISQRPQSVNKEVLNQVEALFVGQLSGPQERKAIEQWVSERQGERKLLDQLPSLPVGTMVLWSPQWLGVLKKVRIGKKQTFDASATPELGATKLHAQTLAKVDVEGLRAALEELDQPPPAPKGKGAAATAPTKIEQRANEAAERMLRERVSQLEVEVERLRAREREMRGRVRDVLLDCMTQVVLTEDAVRGALETLAAGQDIAPAPAKKKPRALELVKPPKLSDAKVQPRATPVVTATTTGGGMQRMLTVLATFYPGTMTRPQIARAADVKIGGGTFAKYWSNLKREALVEELAGKRYRITQAGLAKLGAERPEVPPDLDGRVAFWNARLHAGARRILAEVLAAGERGRTRSDLAARTELEESGGTFSKYLSTLSTNRLVMRQGNVIVPHPWLLTGSD